MKRILILLTLISFYSNKTKAQMPEWMFSAGAGFTTLTADGESVSLPWASFTPRLNFKEFSNGTSTLSLSAPLALGAQFNSREGGYAILELPVFVQYNGGFAANKSTTEGFGYYGGVGFSTLLVSELGALYGPSVSGGVRFIARGAAIELKASYTKDISDNQINSFSLGASYIFGIDL
jgi:hypothetical protein